MRSSLVLTGVFLILWTVLAFGVQDRATWMLENVLVLIFIGPALWLHIKKKISSSGYICLLVFLMFHAVGAHYTYSKVPYNQWSESLLGTSLNEMFDWKRNNFDRLVHFLWGLLLYKPLKDLIGKYSPLKYGKLIVVSFFIIMATSSIYELIEWGAAEAFGEGVGLTYVGAQGDPWDAQKDQALAILGSLVAAVSVYFLCRSQKSRGN